MNNKKFALVLSGGGFKGAFQVGALNYLLQNPLEIDGETVTLDKFDIVTGVSVGALNGAMIATRQLDRLNHLWFEEIANNGPGIIYTSRYLKNGKPDQKRIMDDLVPDLNLWQKLGLIFSKKKRQQVLEGIFSNLSTLTSLADNRPLAQTLKQLLTLDMFDGVTYKTGYVSLADGQYFSDNASDFDTLDELVNAIVASTTMPIVWSPVTNIRTRQGEIRQAAIDGGVRNVTPLKDAIQEINADEENSDYYIIIVNCHPKQLHPFDKQLNIINIASRSLIDITLAEIFQNDVQHFLLVNKILKKLQQPSINLEDKNYKSFKVKIIEPESSLGGSLDASPQVLLDRRDQGFAMARDQFSEARRHDWNV